MQIIESRSVGQVTWGGKPGYAFAFGPLVRKSAKEMAIVAVVARYPLNVAAEAQNSVLATYQNVTGWCGPSWPQAASTAYAALERTQPKLRRFAQEGRLSLPAIGSPASEPSVGGGGGGGLPWWVFLIIAVAVLGAHFGRAHGLCCLHCSHVCILLQILQENLAPNACCAILCKAFSDSICGYCNVLAPFALTALVYE